MSTIAVVGPGSIGCYAAAQLAQAGHDVVACARRPFDRYLVDSDSHPVDREAHVVTEPSQLPAGWSARFVLVCVKAHQTDGASRWLARLAEPGTTVVVVQNGTEGAQRVAPYASGAEVLPSVVYCGAELLGPGHVRHHGFGHLYMPDVAAAHELAAVCDGSGFTVRPDPNFVTELWRKLGSNITANGLTALTGRRLEVLADKRVHPLLRGLLEECYAVARSEGATLGEPEIEAFFTGLAARPPIGGSSMLYDRQAGRPTEHDAIYGAVARAAARHGLATPLCNTMGALIAAGDPPA